MTLELIAISKPLTYASTLDKNKVVIILSDGKIALQHVARCASASRGLPIAYDILREVRDKSKRDIRIRMQWVPLIYI